MKGIYVHIPFCEHICHYCDFVKRVPKNKEMVDSYLVALRNEILSYQEHFDTIETIYIGGGTPSMLDESELIYLFESLKDIHPVEYSIEVNPESYTPNKGEIFKRYGVNRVSLGVQTFNEKLLTYLNRKHSNAKVYDVVSDLKSLGIPYISLDLIYAIPGQTMEDLEQDLEHIRTLNVSHVSCYSLILEEKTYFYHQYLRGKFEQMDEDLEAMMYQKVMEKLKEQDFEHYEISNYAKHGHYSKHNLIYWTLGEYIGVGLGAHGFVNNHRTLNHRALPKYLNTPLELKTYQDVDMRIQDELIFGLRKIQGIHVKEIENKYNISLISKYPKLQEKIDLGLVEWKGEYLKLTEKGIFLGNQVFMVFV